MRQRPCLLDLPEAPQALGALDVPPLELPVGALLAKSAKGVALGAPVGDLVHFGINALVYELVGKLVNTWVAADGDLRYCFGLFLCMPFLALTVGLLLRCLFSGCIILVRRRQVQVVQFYLQCLHHRGQHHLGLRFKRTPRGQLGYVVVIDVRIVRRGLQGACASRSVRLTLGALRCQFPDRICVYLVYNCNL